MKKLFEGRLIQKRIYDAAAKREKSYNLSKLEIHILVQYLLSLKLILPELQYDGTAEYQTPYGYITLIDEEASSEKSS